MSELRQVISGILAALLSVSITLGSLYLAFVEGGQPLAALATPGLVSTEPLPVQPFETLSLPLPASPTASLPGSQTGSTSTASPATSRPGRPSPTPRPAQAAPNLPAPTPLVAVHCEFPDGWSPITIQPEDTLQSLAYTYNTTKEALMQANCLPIDILPIGKILYVPGPAPTQPPVPCGPPWGWVFYTVRSGDTLSAIGRAFGVSVFQLQQANCMGTNTQILAGQRIYVPNFVPPTAVRTSTETSTPVPAEPLPVTATWPPEPTVAATATTSPTDPVPATATEEPTATETATPTPTDTFTPTPTATSTPTPTDTPTATPTLTETPSVVEPATEKTPIPLPTDLRFPHLGRQGEPAPAPREAHDPPPY